LVFLAVMLEVRTYLFDRSLWVDEAMLALNVVSKSFARLAGALDFHQVAPVGFLWAVRLSVRLFGSSEYALRLVPLLAGLGSVFLFYFLCRRLLGPGIRSVALALFAVSSQLVYYSSELKPYSVDVFLCLALLCPVLLSRPSNRLEPWLFLAPLGAVAVWCSFPSIFVLAAVVATFGWLALRHRRWRVAAAVVGCGTAWLLSFGAEFLLLLRSQSRMSKLQEYWAGQFAPLPPRSFEGVRWFTDKFFDFFTNPAGFNRADVAALLFLVGVLHLWRRDRVTLALLTLPAGFALLASSAHLYPFSGRLLLFLVPLAIVVIATGLEPVARLRGRYSRALLYLVLAFLTFEPGLHAVYRLARPRGREEMRSVLAYIQAHRLPGDLVYVDDGGMAAFLYYARRFGFREDRTVFGEEHDTSKGYRMEVARLPAGRRVWAVYSHTGRSRPCEVPSLMGSFEARGDRLQSYQATGACTDLYRLGRGVSGPER